MISSIIRAYNIEDIVKKHGNVKQVSAGTNHTIFLLNDGTCKAVGSNDYGQLGDGTTTNRSTPVIVQGINNCIGVSAGNFYFTIFLLSDDTCKAVGYNANGELGDGTKISRSTPVTVQDINNCIGISAGAANTVFLLNDGTCKAVGYNANKQLGDGTATNRITPVFVLDTNS